MMNSGTLAHVLAPRSSLDQCIANSSGSSFAPPLPFLRHAPATAPNLSQFFRLPPPLKQLIFPFSLCCTAPFTVPLTPSPLLLPPHLPSTSACAFYLVPIAPRSSSRLPSRNNCHVSPCGGNTPTLLQPSCTSDHSAAALVWNLSSSPRTPRPKVLVDASETTASKGSALLS